MKKINLIASLILLSFVYQNAQAMPTKPNHCPSVSAIKTRGLDVATLNITGWFVGVVSEQYDTDVLFTFAIANVNAKNAASAKNLASEALKTIALEEGPTLDAMKTHWVCKYKTRYPAEAWTPANGNTR